MMKKLLSPVKKLWVIAKARPVTLTMIISIIIGATFTLYLIFVIAAGKETVSLICDAVLIGACIFLVAFFAGLSVFGEKIRMARI